MVFVIKDFVDDANEGQDFLLKNQLGVQIGDVLLSIGTVEYVAPHVSSPWATIEMQRPSGRVLDPAYSPLIMFDVVQPVSSPFPIILTILASAVACHCWT